MGRWSRALPRQMGGISWFHTSVDHEQSQTQTIRGLVDTHWRFAIKFGPSETAPGVQKSGHAQITKSALLGRTAFVGYLAEIIVLRKIVHTHGPRVGPTEFCTIIQEKHMYKNAQNYYQFVTPPRSTYKLTAITKLTTWKMGIRKFSSSKIMKTQWTCSGAPPQHS